MSKHSNFWLMDGSTFGRTLQTALTSNQIDLSKIGVLMKGAVPPARVSGFSYTATTTSITWVWKGLTIYRADGTKISIADGSQAVTGLSANETYQFYPYYDEATATFIWVTTADVSFPSFTCISLAGAGEVTTTTSLTEGANNESVELWFSTSTATTPLVLFSTSQTGVPGGTVTTEQFILELVSGQVQFSATTSSGIFSVTSFTPTLYNDGNLHHIVGTFSSVSPYLRLHIDGVLNSENLTFFVPTNKVGWWRIGRNSAGFANAKISHVAVYPAALTDGQVSLHYIAGINLGMTAYEAAVLNDSPDSFWELTETSGTSAADSSATGTNTGTYAGTVVLNQPVAVDSGVGSPAYAWLQPSILTAQAQSLQGRSPLSAGAMIATTTATGTGGGTAGGSTGGGSFGGGNTPPQGCFSGNTKIKTKRGDVAFSDLKVGDLVLTARKTWKPISKIAVHENWSGLIHDMGQGEMITSNHPILVEGKWTAAGNVFGAWSFSNQTVFNLEVDATDDIHGAETEHSFTLSNGLIAHNFKLI